jgi:hypothetical protein
MFTEIMSASQDIQLFTLENSVFAMTGPQLARASRGRLEALPLMAVVGSADGVESPPTSPIEVLHLYGRWPDSAWATVTLGWKIGGTGGGCPGYPVPDYAIIRWNEARSAWIKQLDLNWIASWPGGVLAGSLDGKFRWADGSNTPVPTVLTEGVMGSPWSAPMSPCTTKEGDIYVNFGNSSKYEPGWWVFPRGSAEGERVIMPPGMASRDGWLSSSRRADVLYVVGTLDSGEMYLGVRTGGTWQQLPPPVQGQPCARFDVGLFESSSGWLIAAVRIPATDETAYYKLSGGSRWQSLPLKRPFAEKEVDRQMSVIGKDDDLWLSARFTGKNRSVLYHASL